MILLPEYVKLNVMKFLNREHKTSKIGSKMGKRIDSLKPDTKVSLRFHGSKRFGNEPSTLDYVFKEIVGTGEDRRAIFDEGFEAYRFNGHWAYGTSAEHLSLVS